MTGHRLLISGSRNLRNTIDNRAIIRDALTRAIVDMTDPTLVTGGQMSTDIATGERYGADHLVAVEWALLPPPARMIEVHRAAWKQYGRAAGPKRNQLMVDLGATRMVAFPIGDDTQSRGTWDCIRRARKAGIPVTVYGMGPT
jgi:hypothetical protein